jgi:hypothetical protein
MKITPEPDSKGLSRPVLTGLLVGIAIEVPAMLLAILSGGAGHGDYLLARALFPLPMLLTLLGPAALPIIWIGCTLQWPLYGVLIGRSARERRPRVATGLAVLHLSAAIACLALPGFS